MNKLIIQGKAWGEFEEAKKIKGDIHISGYRTYGGTHTVRGVEQPTLNENQQEILDWLQAYGDKDGGDKPFQTIFYISECLRTGRLDYSTLANLSKLNRKQQAQVLQLFANWVLDQEAE